MAVHVWGDELESGGLEVGEIDQTGGEKADSALRPATYCAAGCILR